MKTRNPHTPLRALQVLYDLAAGNTMARDPKAAEALEKVRVHFGLKDSTHR